MHWLEGEDRPRCDCHDEPMIVPSRWRCKIKVKEYKQTPEYKKINKRYYTSPKGLETANRYRQSPRGQEKDARNNERRLFVGKMYLGKIGFTQAETKEMIEHGKTE